MRENRGFCWWTFVAAVVVVVVSLWLHICLICDARVCVVWICVWLLLNQFLGVIFEAFVCGKGRGLVFSSRCLSRHRRH